MNDQQKFWLKVALAVTWVLWIFPFVVWQGVSEMVERRR